MFLYGEKSNFTISHLTSFASSSAARLSLPAAWRRIRLNRHEQAAGRAHSEGKGSSQRGEKFSRCELERAGCSFSLLCRQLLIPVLPSSFLSHTQAFLYEPHSDSSVTISETFLLMWEELNCVCNREYKQEYSGLQPGCSLESPGESLKPPNVQAISQTNCIRILKEWCPGISIFESS